MSMNKRKFLAAVAVAGVVAGGASAFTAGNSVLGDNVAGYGTATVTGATTSGMVHTLSADGTTIDSTVITFTTTQTARTVVAGFGVTALEDCDVDIVDGLTATCEYAVGYDTEDATEFVVAVS